MFAIICANSKWRNRNDALDQPLKMHINQERLMKEQMDGSARSLLDKSVWYVDEDTCVLS